MFPPTISSVFTLVLFVPVVVVSGTNRTSAQRKSQDFRYFSQRPSERAYYGSPSSGAEYSQVSGHSVYTPSASDNEPLVYYGPGSGAAYTTRDEYIPGPPPPQSHGYNSKPYRYSSRLPRPLYSSSYGKPGEESSSLYHSETPSISQYAEKYNSHHHHHRQNDEPPLYSSGSLGYQPNLSPYGQSYSPAIYPYYSPSSSSGYLPGKPPSHGHGHQHHHHHHSRPHHHHHSEGPSASASISVYGPGEASASLPSYGHGGSGWIPGYPPSPSSYPLPSEYPPSKEPDAEDIYGWGQAFPSVKPSYKPIPEEYGWGQTYPSAKPTFKPVPEFNHQFSLKPSSFGWETSYNVPCGNYKIQPRVMAHLRLATQASLPTKSTGSNNEFPPGNKYRDKRSHSVPLANSFLDPFKLERSLQSYNPYQSQPFTQTRPTFRPRTCRWNFNAEEGCKLEFKCGWFQLPALFRCEENTLRLTDNTLLLNETFCGNRRPRSNQIFISNSGKLSLRFESRGSALPAVLDCTVLCTPLDDLGSELDRPSPTEVIIADVPSSSFPGEQPSLRPSFPTLAHQHGLVSSASINQGQKQPQQQQLLQQQQQQQLQQLQQQQQQGKNSTLKYPPPKPQLRMGSCKCGVPDSHFASKIVHGRIVGGSSTVPGESPWTAALVKRNSNRPYCGASLLNNRFLLTAAHCVFNQARKTRLDQNDSNAGATVGNKTKGKEPQIYFDVLLNEHDISQPNEIAGGTIRAKVDKVIAHPLYDNVTFNFDAALIRLAEPIEFNSWTERKIPLVQIYQINSHNDSSSRASSAFATGSSSGSSGSKLPTSHQHRENNSNTHRLFHNIFDFHSLKRKKRFLIPEIEARAIPPKPVPICLPDADSTSSEERKGRNTPGDEDNFAVVTGWGLQQEGGHPSTEMLKARVEIFNDSVCQDLYKKHNYVITDSMMCAGYINGKIDSCVGDSGSPLATEDKDRFVLTGVVSWGRGCGRKQLPGVYTKVAEMTDWIYSEASTNDAVWCE